MVLYFKKSPFKNYTTYRRDKLEFFQLFTAF
jgi:hypothetical protein